MHLFVSPGPGEFVARLPAALFGALVLGACFCLARRLFDRTVALLTTLLLALSPLHLHYAQEARMYTLLEGLALLSLCCFVRAIQTKKPRYWLGYGLIILTSIYTHYFTVFYVVVQGVFLSLLTVKRRVCSGEAQIGSRVWLGFVLSLLAVTLLYLPWLPYALGRPEGGGFRLDLAQALTATLHQLGHGQMTALPYLFAGLFLGGLVAAWRTGRSEQGWLLGLCDCRCRDTSVVHTSVESVFCGMKCLCSATCITWRRIRRQVGQSGFPQFNVGQDRITSSTRIILRQRP